MWKRIIFQVRAQVLLYEPVTPGTEWFRRRRVTAPSLYPDFLLLALWLFMVIRVLVHDSVNVLTF